MLIRWVSAKVFVFGFVSLGVTTAIGLLFMLTNEPSTIAENDTADITTEFVGPPPPPPEVAEVSPRRLPIGGTGNYMAIEPDGSAYLVSSDGTRSQVMNPTPRPIPPTVTGRATMPQRIIGQIIVCDTGLVDVPKNAIVTYVGRDRVTILNDDGSSTTYFVDGHSEHWARDQKTPAKR